MSESLEQTDISTYQQGSEYQALLLDAMLEGKDEPVPPYECLAQVAGNFVVRDMAIVTSTDPTPQNSDTILLSDTHTTNMYRKNIKVLNTLHDVGQKKDSYTPIARLEKYLGASLDGLCYSWKAAELVSGWVGNLGNRNIGKHVVIEAVTTQEGLRSALDKVAQIAPHLLLPEIQTYSGFVPRETIRGWIDAVSTSTNHNHTRAFIYNLTKSSDYFEGEEEVLAERVKASLTKMYCSDALNALAKRPVVLQYLTPSEARQITANKLADLPTGATFPNRDIFDTLVEYGLATPEQIDTTIADALIANQDAHSTALKDPKDMLSEAGIARVKASLLEQVSEPVDKYNGHIRSNSLTAIIKCGLFSDEELKGVFETCIEQGESNRLVSHIEIVSEILTPAQTEAIITDAVEQKSAGFFYEYTLSKVLEKVNLAPDVTLELIKQITYRAFQGNSPKVAARFIEFLPVHMRSKLVRDIIAESPVKNFIYEKSYDRERNDTFIWLTYLGTRSEAIKILRDRIQEAPGFSFIEHAKNWRYDRDYLQLPLFTHREVLDMVRQRVNATEQDGTPVYSTPTILNNFEAIQAILDHDEFVSLIRERAYLTPEVLFSNWKPELSEIFSPDEVMDMLEVAWPSDMVDKPNVSEKLEAYLPKDRLIDLYSSHMALCDQLEHENLGIDEYIDSLDTQTAKLFLRKLLDKNPYRLLESSYASDLLGFEHGELASWINQHTSSFAPKTLSKLNRRHERANPYQQRLVEKEEDDLYQAYAWINHAGLNDTYARLLRDARSEKAERELLHLLSAAARQKHWYKDTPLYEIPDLHGLRSLIEDVTLRELGIDTLSSEKRSTFRELVTDILPFGVYASRYAESAQHRDILKNMLEATTRPGAYSSWRFALDKTDEERKELGWVPNALSEAQFKQWVLDDQEIITLGEARNDAIGKDIAELIQQNVEHLGVSDDFSDPQTQSRLDDLVRKLGQELKNAHANRKQGVDVSNIGEVEDWLKSSKYLRAAYTMHNADRFTDKQIKQVMRDFRSGLPEDGRFLADRVEEMLAFAGTTLEDVVITDTSEPQLTIEIGAKPVPSCQHYANGSANENLLGYFDVDVKPVVIKGKNGNIAARAIMRLLETETGEPVLYVEPAYTSYDYEQVTGAIQNFVAQKAMKMGIAYVNDTDGTDDSDGADSEEVIIRSRGSRAPERYSDSLERYDDVILSTGVDIHSIIRS